MIILDRSKLSGSMFLSLINIEQCNEKAFILGRSRRTLSTEIEHLRSQSGHNTSGPRLSSIPRSDSRPQKKAFTTADDLPYRMGV